MQQGLQAGNPYSSQFISGGSQLTGGSTKNPNVLSASRRFLGQVRRHPYSSPHHSIARGHFISAGSSIFESTISNGQRKIQMVSNFTSKFISIDLFLNYYAGFTQDFSPGMIQVIFEITTDSFDQWFEFW